MELMVKREVRTQNSTIGSFFVNRKFFSYCLEPIDRGLTSSMTLEQIQKIKVQNKTAIPIGRYHVVSYKSPKHGNKEVPLLENVKGFGFVEIHVGNYPKDTDACLLLGDGKTTDMVESSGIVVSRFYLQFFEALKKGEQVWITYS